VSGTIQKRYHWSNQKRKTVSGTIQQRYHWSKQKRKAVSGTIQKRYHRSKKNALKIVLIIVNINKDENKSLISDQLSLKNDFTPLPPPISWRTILRR
jgi:hypothetical protein